MRRILSLIHENPGVNHQGLAELTGYGRTVITGALTALLASGRIRAGQPVDDGRRRAYYVVGFSSKTPKPFTQKED